MRAGWLGQSLDFVASTLLVLAVTQGSAEARSKHTAQVNRHSATSSASFHRVYRGYASHSWSPSWQRSALQCVPFARENSGIELSGNAGSWWDNASGLYERGARPEVGSILNFRATGQMRMGHVAVVANVISPRHIEVDHANWGAPGRVSRNIDVVDVSPSNDWTEVRVALSEAEDYGSVYPTYGFIYDRPDHGTMVANNAPTAAPALRPAPSDQLSSDRITLASTATAPEEVAEAAEDDGDEPAPRYTGHHRRSAHGRFFPLHAASSSRHRGFNTTATTYRVSTSSVAFAKPHKLTRRHF